jgi:hypothetical protein
MWTLKTRLRIMLQYVQSFLVTLIGCLQAIPCFIGSTKQRKLSTIMLISQLDATLCSLIYFLLRFTLHVSGAFCTHHQEYKREKKNCQPLSLAFGLYTFSILQNASNLEPSCNRPLYCPLFIIVPHQIQDVYFHGIP